MSSGGSSGGKPKARKENEKSQERLDGARESPTVAETTTSMASLNFNAFDQEDPVEILSRHFNGLVMEVIEATKNRDWAEMESTATRLLEEVALVEEQRQKLNNEEIKDTNTTYMKFSSILGNHQLVAYAALVQAKQFTQRYQECIDDAKTALELIDELETPNKLRHVVVLTCHGKSLECQYDDSRNRDLLKQAIADCESSWNLVEENEEVFGPSHPVRSDIVTVMLSVKVKLRLADVGFKRPLFTKKEIENLECSLRIGIYSDENHRCLACGSTNEDLLLCRGCSHAWFCNTSCQRSAWKKHKPNCYPKVRMVVFPDEVKDRLDRIATEDATKVCNVFNAGGGDYVVALCDPSTGHYFNALNDCRLYFQQSDSQELKSLRDRGLRRSIS